MLSNAPQPATMQRYDPTVPFAPEGDREKQLAEGGERFVCMVVPIMTAGFLVCSFIMAEGLFLLFNMDAANTGASVEIVGMDAHNPYHHAQKVVLIVVGFVDVFMSFAGVMGCWIASGPPLAMLGAFVQGSFPGFGIGVLLAWRFLVTVATAPWIGFIMAFESSDKREGQCLLVTLAYIAVNIYMLWILVKVRTEAVHQSAILKQRVVEILAERMALAPLREEEPEPTAPSLKIFGCLPLEMSVGVYALVVCVACVWSFVNLCTDGSAQGGWAILTKAAVHNPGGARWLEALVYIVPAVFAGLAVSAILTHGQLSFEEKGSRSMCALLLLFFLLASVARYAAFIPITVLQLAETDLCGFYTYGLSRVASHTSESSIASVTHCSSQELLTVVSVVVTLLLDAYLISGVFRLWQAYNEGQMFASKVQRGYGNYGASGALH